jgi:hypothetical protein
MRIYFIGNQFKRQTGRRAWSEEKQNAESEKNDFKE